MKGRDRNKPCACGSGTKAKLCDCRAAHTPEWSTYRGISVKGSAPAALCRTDQLGASAARMEQLLARYAVSVEPGSSMESMLCHAHALETIEAAYPIEQDARGNQHAFADALSVRDLASKLEQAMSGPHAQRLLPHLRLLGYANPAQNRPADTDDQASDLAFELYVASLVSPVATRLRLDPVRGGSRSSPDIVFDYAGREWAIECKCPRGANPKSACDLIEKAVLQIERSSASRGVVAMSFRNIFPHHLMWRIPEERGEVPGAHLFRSASMALEYMRCVLQDVVDQIRRAQPIEHWRSLFAGRKCQPYVVVPLQTLAWIEHSGRPAPCALSQLEIVQIFPDPPPRDIVELTSALHQAFEPRI